MAADRRCPGQDTLSVREAFATEALRLLTLPDNPYPLTERVPVKAGKTAYVHSCWPASRRPHEAQRARVFNGLPTQTILYGHS
jgi:hypothetical protein